jgi:hypothetical protein
MGSFEDLERAQYVTEKWLRGEQGYQFSKAEVTGMGSQNPEASVDHIVEHELPNKWGRYKSFQDFVRRHELVGSHRMLVTLQASQQVLKMTAAARGAVVWHDVAAGASLTDASEASFGVLQEYYASLRDGRAELPSQALLDAPLAESPLQVAAPSWVIATFDRRALPDVFRESAGLALRHAVATREYTDGALPRPGFPSGEIANWNP